MQYLILSYYQKSKLCLFIRVDSTARHYTTTSSQILDAFIERHLVYFGLLD